jgi:hypothetical protein
MLALLVLASFVGLISVSPIELQAALVSGAGVVILATATTISKELKRRRTSTNTKHKTKVN